MAEEKVAKRTAAQRLDDLERAMMETFQTIDQVVRDVQIVKEAVKLLGNKVDAIVKATSSGQALSDEVLSAIMIENNIAELQAKVTTLRDQGILNTEDVVTEKSFVVGREIDDEGKVVNPRLQFALGAVSENVRAKIAGSKAGDIVNLEEGKLKFEVVETYSIRTGQDEQQTQATSQA